MRITSTCLAICINRIVDTGLQTTHRNCTNALCKVQKWQCGTKFLLMALLVSISLIMWRDRTVTVNAERYQVMLETFLRNDLRPRQFNLMWFQQDGASAHTAQISMKVLRTMFPGTLISRFADITWLARSPDLAVPDYFLWGYVKSKECETCPANIDYLKQWIREFIQGIPKEMLRVMTVFLSRLEVYWKTWWSPTKCHIQTVMIQMNSHGHGMYLLVLITFFHFALKCYFISKTVMCFWRIL
jgi:hypothetical protein